MKKYADNYSFIKSVRKYHACEQYNFQLSIGTRYIFTNLLFSLIFTFLRGAERYFPIIQHVYFIRENQKTHLDIAMGIARQDIEIELIKNLCIFIINSENFQLSIILKDSISNVN